MGTLTSQRERAKRKERGGVERESEEEREIWRERTCVGEAGPVNTFPWEVEASNPIGIGVELTPVVGLSDHLASSDGGGD